SCALVNPQFGPRLRLATLLTDAPLKPDVSMKNKCRNCTKCVDACPVHAITDAPVDIREPRNCRLDFNKCNIYLKAQREKLGAWIFGCCIVACPWENKK
ncbi:MAG: 4Fe-4S double cluster binding domain-containing protein, partial [Clostridiales bacterium]